MGNLLKESTDWGKVIKMTKKEKHTQEAHPVNYVHIDEFLLTKNDISPGVKAGFKVHMKGKTYQTSFEAFEKELEKYQKRKIEDIEDKG